MDLYVATGAQYMADACRDDALQVLDRLEAASRLGVTTAMVGQGLGPIRDAELKARAAAVLPLVDLIFVRERLTAPALLEAFGVDPARVVMTGDDAVEMAYRARAARVGTLGTAIGFSMRRAPYADVGDEPFTPLRLALQQAAGRHGARLVGFPISQAGHEADDEVIGRLLAGLGRASTRRWRFDTPLEIIRGVGRCRLVVTGGFHVAVFALAQGIPAVCLARSAMYMEKFMGLADQFGPGCRVVCLDDEHLQEGLSAAIEAAWDAAGEVRPQLLEAAARQVEMGRAAYRRIYELVTTKSKVSSMTPTGE